MNNKKQLVNIRMADLPCLRNLAREHGLESHGGRTDLLLRLKPYAKIVFDYKAEDPMPLLVSSRKTHDQDERSSIQEQRKPPQKRSHDDDLLDVIDYQSKIRKLEMIERDCEKKNENCLEKEKIWGDKIKASREERRMNEDTCREARMEKRQMKLELKNVILRWKSRHGNDPLEQSKSAVAERAVRFPAENRDGSKSKIVSTNRHGYFVHENLLRK